MQSFIPTHISFDLGGKNKDYRNILEHLFKIHIAVKTIRIRGYGGTGRGITHSQWRRRCADQFGQLTALVTEGNCRQEDINTMLSIVLNNFHESLDSTWINWALILMGRESEVIPIDAPG